MANPDNNTRRVGLPTLIILIQSVIVFVLAAVILGLDIDTKVRFYDTIKPVSTYSRSARQATTVNVLASLMYDPTIYTFSIAICSYYIVMAAINVLQARVNNHHLLQTVITLNFVGTFLGFFIWIPRIDPLRYLSDSKFTIENLDDPSQLMFRKFIVILVFGVLETVICFVYFVASLFTQISNIRNF